MPNPQLENGYTRIANDIVEALCQLKCSNYESRFLWALFRKTYGYQKKEDRISLSQFSKLTNIESHNIARTKTKLLNKKIIFEKNNKIGFNKIVSDWVVSNEIVFKEIVSKQIAGSIQTDIQLVSKQIHTKENITKETYTKENKKKYIKKKIHEIDDVDFQQISAKYEVPISFVRSKYDDMVNWHEATGKRKKDWIATLRNFVKKDAISIRKEASAKSVIAFIKA